MGLFVLGPNEDLMILLANSIQYSRVHRDMIELFKQTTGIYRVDAEYIKLDSSIGNGHDKRLEETNIRL